jgi:4-hydroxybenzoate polyprenyltransferase
MLKKTGEKLLAALDLIRWTKQYGTLLLLAPALWSLVIAAKGAPPLKLIVIFTLGSFLMRSAGCVINDIADRRFDAHVERTRTRPLPSGRLTTRQALMVFCGIAAIAFALTWWLNPLARLLSFVGIALAVVYPFTKRFFNIPQLFMGAAFGWGAVMAWAAVRNAIEPPALLIFLATVCWACAYDTIYALMDREDDARIGVLSSALWFGRNTWIATGILFGLSSLFLTLLGMATHLGPIYYFSVLSITGCFFYQAFLLRNRLDRNRAFRLFKSHAGVGLVVLLGILLGYHIS